MSRKESSSSTCPRTCIIIEQYKASFQSVQGFAGFLQKSIEALTNQISGLFKHL